MLEIIFSDFTPAGSDKNKTELSRLAGDQPEEPGALSSRDEEPDPGPGVSSQHLELETGNHTERLPAYSLMRPLEASLRCENSELPADCIFQLQRLPNFYKNILPTVLPPP